MYLATLRATTLVSLKNKHCCAPGGREVVTAKNLPALVRSGTGQSNLCTSHLWLYNLSDSSAQHMSVSEEPTLRRRQHLCQPKHGALSWAGASFMWTTSQIWPNLFWVKAWRVKPTTVKLWLAPNPSSNPNIIPSHEEAALPISE